MSNIAAEDTRACTILTTERTHLHLQLKCSVSTHSQHTSDEVQLYLVMPTVCFTGMLYLAIVPGNCTWYANRLFYFVCCNQQLCLATVRGMHTVGLLRMLYLATVLGNCAWQLYLATLFGNRTWQLYVVCKPFVLLSDKQHVSGLQIDRFTCTQAALHPQAHPQPKVRQDFFGHFTVHCEVLHCQCV